MRILGKACVETGRCQCWPENVVRVGSIASEAMQKGGIELRLSQDDFNGRLLGRMRTLFKPIDVTLSEDRD